MSVASVFGVLAIVSAVLAASGLVIVLIAATSVRRFAREACSMPTARPAVTVLRPLCGDEPGLEAALASLCNQAYPAFQIVFGVQDANDPSLRVVETIRERFPRSDISVVVSAALHGSNRKVSNLMNMIPVARHEMLVFSDSDLHLPPHYLDSVVAALERPGAGLVTTVCIGLPTAGGFVGWLGAAAISHCFLPGALLSRELGRQDCYGTTMALRHDTLMQLGGLQTLVDHLADDNVLGQLVKRLGLTIELASSVPMTAVPEDRLGALWLHELRWARTIRRLEPILFAASAVQFPMFWATAAIVFSGGSVWCVALFALAWAVRLAAARSIDLELAQDTRSVACDLWLLPARDLMSVSCIAASYLGSQVLWRGQVMRADDGRVPEGNRALASAP